MVQPTDSRQMESRINGQKCCHKYTCWGYHILHFAFALIPIVAGLDKFFNYLTHWEQYLSAPFNVLGNPHSTMLLVGVIEIIAGIGVALKPKYFAFIVSAWLLAIIINLLVLHNYYDIAARDLGLSLSALSLGFLSLDYDPCKTRIRE